MFNSKELAKQQALTTQPIKAIGAIAGVVGATKVYYVKSPVRARLGAVIALMDATTDIAKAITISKAQIAAATSPFDPLNIKPATELTTVPAAISSTALLTGTTTTTASAIVMVPSTDYSATKIIIEKDECLAISVADPTTGKKISGQIVIEFIPA